MKNRFLIISLMLLPTLAFTQTNSSKNMRLGFTASPTFGWMQNFGNTATVSIKGNGSKTGFSYGVLGDFGFSENYFFSTAFVLTTINSKVTYTQNALVNERIYKLQYFEVPLTIKLKTSDIGDKKFYGQFGLVPGVKTSSKQIDSGNAAKDDTNILRLGLLIGGGAEWKVSGVNILTGLSYNNGLTKTIDNPDAKNAYFALNLGVFF